jgi:hypothetical protein
MPIDSTRQKLHYETIHLDYEDHYYDAQSMRFREQFYYGPLFEGSILMAARLRIWPAAVVTVHSLSLSAFRTLW